MLSFKEHINDPPLVEAALGKSQVIKPSKSITGNIRAQDLYAKLKRGEPFETVDSSPFGGRPIELEFINSTIEKAFRDGNEDGIPDRGPIFKERGTNNEVTLTHLKKTAEFGSSRGSGGGAGSTATNETTQAVYMAYAFNVKKGKVSSNESISVNDLRETYNKYVRSDTPFDKLIEASEFSDKEWIYTFTESANQFYSWFKSNRNASGPFFFHRGSKFMIDIYKTAKDLRKSVGITIADDKWNPGDIWMTNSAGVNVVTQKYTSIGAYNDVIGTAYMSGDLMGISLKKVGKTIKLKEFNVPGSDDGSKVGIRSLLLNGKNGRGSFFENNKVYMHTDGGKTVEFRSFQRDQNFQSQILGSKAAGGKMSLGPINATLKMLNMPTLPNGNDITKVARRPTDKFYTGFYSLFKRYADRSETDISQDEFVSRIEQMGNNASSFRFSKFLAVSLVDILTRNKAKADEFATEVFQYAASKTKISSAFIKIF